MCYSAQIMAEHKKYVRLYGAIISLVDYAALFWARVDDDRIKIPKAMEQAFAEPQNATERDIFAAIEQYKAKQVRKFEEELVVQRQRRADADRKLLVKATKTAGESRRIATDKLAALERRLQDLGRAKLDDSDHRIYPGYYTPVIVVKDGRRVVVPMRYQCRPAGKPESYDRQYPGTYNARRDNLEGFWRGQFGHTHGVMVVNAFYEHVDRPRVAGSPETESVILEYRPRPQQDMLVACLWSRWRGDGNTPDLLSCAAITDNPPEEVAATGLDRCVIPIKAEHLDAWLNPNPKDWKALYAILDDRDRPYYENRLAA
jgi:putative SOS response-associated peptidase YedK